MQFKEASRLTLQPNPRIFASISTIEARINMPKKFDGRRSKFQGFL